MSSIVHGATFVRRTPDLFLRSTAVSAIRTGYRQVVEGEEGMNRKPRCQKTNSNRGGIRRYIAGIRVRALVQKPQGILHVAPPYGCDQRAVQSLLPDAEVRQPSEGTEEHDHGREGEEDMTDTATG